MPAKRPTKKSKAAGKKAAKRGVAKKATPRKARGEKHFTSPPSARERNAQRLQEDIEYYRDQPLILEERRTKGTKKNPQGVRIKDLVEIFDSRGHVVGYRSKDSDIRLTVTEFHKIADNPRAIRHYIPIYGERNAAGKRRIVAFRNASTQERVTPHYRYRVLGKYFRTIPEGLSLQEEEPYVEKSRLYQASIDYWRRKDKERTEDLIQSYRLKMLAEGREMSREDVIDDPEFQGLVDELIEFSRVQHSFTKEYVGSIDFAIEEFNIEFGQDISQFTPKQIKDLYGMNPRYQEVLVLLGRRLPTEDRPVGSYPKGYMKDNVVPFYQAYIGAEEFEG